METKAIKSAKNAAKTTNNKKTQTKGQKSKKQPNSLEVRQKGVEVAYGNLQAQKAASFSSSKGGNFMVKHREFIQDLIGTDSAFVVTQYPINPGLPNLFPWLSTIATRFQKYRFHNLRFCYQVSAPSTQGGYVMIVPDYDSSDQIPTSKEQALQFQSAVRSNVWDPFCLICRQTDLKALPQYYIRGGSLPSNVDIKTYDVGQIFTAMVGPPATLGPVGELWVEYEVELISPIITNNPSNLSQLFFVANNVAFDLGFGSNQVDFNVQNLAYSISSSGRILNFGQGFQAMLYVVVTGASGSPTGPNISGATTNGYVQLLSSIISANTAIAYFYINMQQGNYLAFDGWFNDDTSHGQIFYSFAPCLSRLWA
jgi:hypothetical protein